MALKLKLPQEKKIDETSPSRIFVTISLPKEQAIVMQKFGGTPGKGVKELVNQSMLEIQKLVADK